DGNGDGIARRDIGAVEMPGVDPPATPGDAPAPASDPAPVAPAVTPVPPAEPAAVDKQAPLVSGFLFKSKRFRYTISERASVVIRITHGRRIVARIARRAGAGANSQRIGKALKPGRYSAVLTATDAAGNHSLPKRVRFRIIAR